MNEIFKTFISLIILLIISSLIYMAWILNKGEFSSQYLEKFINDRFKSEKFYTSIKNPTIKFDKEEKKIIVNGKKFSIFSIDNKKISEFDNLKVHINFLPLITERKLDTNKIEMINGFIDMPSVFNNKLKINSIKLKGNLTPDNNQIIVDKFSTSIEEDFYEGFAEIDLKKLEANGSLTKLFRKKIFYNLDLESEDLKFLVNSLNFDIEGKAVLGGVDIFLKGKKNYKNKKEFASKYILSGNINADDIEESFGLNVSEYIQGDIKLDSTYFIFEKGKEKIKTLNQLTETELNIPFLDLKKEKGISANAEIDFNFLNGKLDEVSILNYKDVNNEMNGLIKLSEEFKPYKNLEIDLKKDEKKLSVKVLRDKKLSKLELKGDYFDFSKILEESLSNKNDEESFLDKLEPININIQAKEILFSEKNVFYNFDASMMYSKKLFQSAKVETETKNKENIKVHFVRKKDINSLDLNGDYFDFSETLKNFFDKDDEKEGFLDKLQPVNINLKAKKILVAKEKSIFETSAILQYKKKLFNDVKLDGQLNNQKKFTISITPKKDSRELVINSEDAGLFLETFNINKSGKEGELVMHGKYDDTKNTHPLVASVTIRNMRLIKAPTLAKILNLASIGIVSTLSGEGILINKLKSEFELDEGVLDLKKYEAYGPDVGFSNQGKIYLREKEIDLEGAIIPMVTLNKIIGSIPVLGKILTNERKGIWSFIYTITGDLNEPNVNVNPLKTITPGFIQKFFSVFNSEKKEEN